LPYHFLLSYRRREEERSGIDHRGISETDPLLKFGAENGLEFYGAMHNILTARDSTPPRGSPRGVN
jgi:hypothetical protein